MLSGVYAWLTRSSSLFGREHTFIHFIMQQKYDANWPEVALCGRAQGKYASVDNGNASNFSYTYYASPNGMQSYSCLDSSLCPDVSSWSEVFPQEHYGRLLKLVDRTDLGSVGESHESSSLSPPTWIKLASIIPFIW
jgi:hypothetical protein